MNFNGKLNNEEKLFESKKQAENSAIIRQPSSASPNATPMHENTDEYQKNKYFPPRCNLL